MTVSKYVSKFEGYVLVNSLQPLVDRYRMLHEIYELEMKFEYEKYRQVEILMEIYEHETDPLNSHKLTTEIFSLMGKSPKVDFE